MTEEKNNDDINQKGGDSSDVANLNRDAGEGPQGRIVGLAGDLAQLQDAGLVERELSAEEVEERRLFEMWGRGVEGAKRMDAMERALIASCRLPANYYGG